MNGVRKMRNRVRRMMGCWRMGNRVRRIDNGGQSMENGKG